MPPIVAFPPRAFANEDRLSERSLHGASGWMHAVSRSVTLPPRRFAIVLDLDDLAAAGVRQLIRRLAPVAAPAAANVPPHVTLAACRNLDVEAFRAWLAEIATRTPVVATTLASLGVFPGEGGVIFLAPTISRRLVELQLQMLSHLQEPGEVEIEPYWLPGQWMPHCTLATGIPRERMATALGLVYEVLRPISASLTRLSVFDIEPPRLLFAFDLSG
jgi:2'-5' RNA ligase